MQTKLIFTLTLALVMRLKATRKWPIRNDTGTELIKRKVDLVRKRTNAFLTCPYICL